MSCQNHVSTPEVHAELVAAKGSQALTRRTIERWISAFNNGNESVEDKPCPGHPREATTPETIAKVEKLVIEDPHTTTRELSDLTGISQAWITNILTNELGMRKVCAKWVPHVLSEKNKKKRVAVSRKLLKMMQKGYRNVVTGDETWIHYFTVSNKKNNQQWVKKGESRPQIIRTAQFSKKRMFCIFFSVDGAVACKVLKKGSTINSKYYVNDILPEVLDKFKKKKERQSTRDIMLHHDNASSHMADIVTKYLKRERITLLPHPLYSPDLAPCDFFLFPKLKQELAGRHFEQIENLARAMNSIINSIPNQVYEKCFQDWQNWLKRCIEVGGGYFEGMM
ncbi:24693_t:CDS:2 [Gigaspora margarita]|uniref:24693_t:CDS:1 n=1 Tax=Gigaspora margarita TaxID=4874 RepID=A0ABN7UK47_GIGMA|nr:24693_t:CDS:2 [Gigaspora margarita]